MTEFCCTNTMCPHSPTCYWAYYDSPVRCIVEREDDGSCKRYVEVLKWEVAG